MAKSAKEEGPPQIGVAYTVVHQTQERALMVPLTNWKRHMSNIKRCTTPEQDYGAIGWSCFSAALSCLLAAVSLPVTTEFVKHVPDGTGNTIEHTNIAAIVVLAIFVAVAFGLGFSGYIAIRFAKGQTKMRSDYAIMVVKEMEEYENFQLGTLVTAGNDGATGIPGSLTTIPTTN